MCCSARASQGMPCDQTCASSVDGPPHRRSPRMPSKARVAGRASCSAASPGLGCSAPARSAFDEVVTASPRVAEGKNNVVSVRLARPRKTVRNDCGDGQGAQAAGGGAQRHRARRGGAGFRHPREHQARRDSRHRSRQDQIYRGRRHPRAEAGDHRQIRARERAHLCAEPDHRRHRRQAGALQRADGDAEPR